MTERLPSALEFLRDVGTRVGSVFGDLHPAISGGTLIIDRGDPAHPVTLAFGPDGRGHVKLYSAAFVTHSESRAAGARLGRVLGTVQVIPADDHYEVRRWSPYRLEDVERSRADAEEWGASTLVSLLRELPAALETRPQPGSPPTDVVAEPTRGMPLRIGRGHDALLQAVGTDLETRMAALIIERDRLRLEVSALRAGANAGDDVARLGADLDAARREAVEALALAESMAMDAESQRRLLEESRAAAAQLEAERDVALGRVRALEVASENAGQSDGRLPVDKIRRLVDSYSLISDSGARAVTCAAVLRHFLDIVPGDAELSELLGKELLRDDQVREAIRVLSAIGVNALTPRGAAAMTEAAFRSKELPDPLDVIGRVDWLVGGVAQQLREVPRWKRGPELLRLAELVAENAPPDVGAFLSEVGRVAAREQLERLFSLWLELDLQAALDELVSWAEENRVQSSEKWVRDGLQLALNADERRTVRAALDLLAREAERSRDPEGMLDLVDMARDRLRSADSRDFTVKWLREVTASVPARGDADWMDRAATALLAVLSDMRALRDDSPEYALALLLITRASEEAAAVLRQAVDERRPKADVSIRDVTTVAEALQAAAERFPDLVVLPDAEKSAARRGTGSVKKAREALLQLGEIAQRYAAGELDEGLDEALGALPDFKQDISDTSKRQYAKDYARVLPDGRRVTMGPHFDIGGEDGRAYLYIDREGKRIVLGHCGGHLRGRRDS